MTYVIPALISMVLFAFITLLYIRELSWCADLIEWETKHGEIVREIILAASLASYAPNRSQIQFNLNGDPIWQAGSGLLPFAVNFDTLKVIVKTMIEVEDAQRVAGSVLKESLERLRVFERETPQPQPPTVFGKRIWLPH